MEIIFMKAFLPSCNEQKHELELDSRRRISGMRDEWTTERKKEKKNQPWDERSISNIHKIGKTNEKKKKGRRKLKGVSYFSTCYGKWIFFC